MCFKTFQSYELFASYNNSMQNPTEFIKTKIMTMFSMQRLDLMFKLNTSIFEYPVKLKIV